MCSFERAAKTGPEKPGLIIADVTYHAGAPLKGLNRSIARAAISPLMHIADAWLASRIDRREQGFMSRPKSKKSDHVFTSWLTGEYLKITKLLTFGKGTQQECSIAYMIAYAYLNYP